LKYGLPALPDAVAESKTVAESALMTQFVTADALIARPPSIEPTLFKMDLVHALSWSMVPFILIFLFMDLFDTLGTLVGVSEQAGFIKDNKLPRAREALLSDALGTVAGAALGTSTATSFIESASGVEQGGRTGLTALCVAGLFLLALFFSPVIAMVGSYTPITAPALVVVGSMMMRNVTKIDWSNYAESMPAFLVIIGIPLTYSIADGLALGFIAYPIIKLLAGQGREVKWLMYVMALVLVAYFVLVRAHTG
jgi:AGZA family xanthine/uracil permease-like MFS transporter